MGGLTRPAPAHHAASKWLIGLGSLGLALCAVLVTALGAWLGLRPLVATPLDGVWYALDAGLVSSVGLLVWLRRGRVLLASSVVLVAAFLLVTTCRAGVAGAYLALVWILAVAAALGHWLLQVAAPRIAHGAMERLLLATSIGLGALALLALPLGLLELYYRPVAYGLLLALSVLLGPSFLRWLSPRLQVRLQQARATWAAQDLRAPAALVAVMAIGLLGGLAWAIAPATHFDALTYHLGVPAIYVRDHALVQVPEEYRSVWAHNTEMLYTLGLLVAGQPLPGLVHLATGLLGAGFVFVLARRMAGVRVGLLAGALYYMAPMVTFESGAALNDLSVAMFAVGSVCCLAAWWFGPDQEQWLIVGGAFAGLALGSKLSAGLVLAPLSLLLGVKLVARHGLSRRAVVGLVRFAVPALLLVAPWLLRDWLWTGNPVFPFLNGVFHSPLAPDANTWESWSRFGKGGGAFHFVCLPWDLVVTGRAFTEAAPQGTGGLPLLALPWLYLLDGAKRRAAAMLGTLALLSLALWFTIGQYLRLYLVGLPILALLAALNVDSVWEHVARRRPRQLYGVVAVILALAYVLASRWVHTSHWVRAQPDRYPYRLALGLQTPQSFLSEAIPAYDAFRFLARQGDGRHSILGFDMDARLYTDCRVESMGVERLLFETAESPPPQEIARQLAARGYGYIIVARRKPKPLNEAFLRQYARLEFARHQVSVYRFHPDGVAPEESIELLQNGGLEEGDADACADSWVLVGTPLIDRTGAWAHRGQAAARVDPSGGIVQRVAVEENHTYLLRFWARAEGSAPAVALRLHWLDATLQPLAEQEDVLSVASAWQGQEETADSPPAAAWLELELAGGYGSQVWLDDVSLVEHG